MRYLISIFVLSSFLASFTLLSELKSVDYKVDSKSTLTIEGTSNVHEWIANVNKVTGNANFSFSDDGMIKINNCEINVDAKSIKSTKGSIMDGKIYKALNTDAHATITFKMKSLGAVSKTSNGFNANVYGYLTIAGVTKVISLDIVAKEVSDGSYEISGSEKLKMTTFGIDPPTAMMGAMTTGDEVTINFRTVLVQK